MTAGAPWMVREVYHSIVFQKEKSAVVLLPPVPVEMPLVNK
jgi:hypothetical protein